MNANFYEIATEAFNTLEKSSFASLKDKLYQSAFRYMAYRFQWNFNSLEQKLEMDEHRSLAHNTFIMNCDIMARNMASKGEPAYWRKNISDDRKVIGDFACLLVALIGIKNR